MDLNITPMPEQRVHAKENSLAYWQAHIEACKASKQSRLAYCRSQGIAYHRFKYWTSKLQRKSAPIKAIPVRIQAQDESPSLLCAIKLPQGRELNIYDHQALATILKRLL
jgi:hypothetical protein